MYSVGVLPPAAESPLDRPELKVGFEPFVSVYADASRLRRGVENEGCDCCACCG
jgi:hypothetical protein